MDASSQEHKVTPAIRATDLLKEVETASGSLRILTAVNLLIKPAETVAITGTSGSGKSTLLGILAGLDQPSSGEVFLKGHDLTRLDEDQRALVRAQHVGFVFQSFQLIHHLSALENVMLPLELRGDKTAAARATALLGKVGLQNRLHHTPRQLSGGEQQRVALARAFVGDPDILFADEPTGNLDRETGASVIDLLMLLNLEHQTTLILVTHDPSLAGVCQRVIAIESGRVIQDQRL